MLFPDVEPALLEAAFQESNGHLEQTVELLLTAMFFSSLDTNGNKAWKSKRGGQRRIES
jgi:hypothetical protein